MDGQRQSRSDPGAAVVLHSGPDPWPDRVVVSLTSGVQKTAWQMLLFSWIHQIYAMACSRGGHESGFQGGGMRRSCTLCAMQVQADGVCAGGVGRGASAGECVGASESA